MNKTKAITYSVVLLILLGLGFGLWFYRYATTGPKGTEGKKVTLWIKPGQSFFTTIDQLKSAGLVRHPDRFRWLAYLQGYERQVRAGEYELSTSMSPAAILHTLVHGQPILHKVVLPEGITMIQIAELLQNADLVGRKAFLDKSTDADFAAELGISAPTLEGYLFPETYYFPKGISAGEIIVKMVNQFRSVFTPAWEKQARMSGMSIHEVVTLASIVEKETGKAEERPLIASVFLNRLERNMRLESDPTVIYGLKAFSGNLTRRDLQTPTAYNTYTFKGLPPGPIANPGKASLEAVLYPAEEPYLYFVSKNDGSHHFSSTFAEHRKMVRKYQLNQR